MIFASYIYPGDQARRNNPTDRGPCRRVPPCRGANIGRVAGSDTGCCTINGPPGRLPSPSRQLYAQRWEIENASGTQGDPSTQPGSSCCRRCRTELIQEVYGYCACIRDTRWLIAFRRQQLGRPERLSFTRSPGRSAHHASHRVFPLRPRRTPTMRHRRDPPRTCCLLESPRAQPRDGQTKDVRYQVKTPPPTEGPLIEHRPLIPPPLRKRYWPLSRVFAHRTPG